MSIKKLMGLLLAICVLYFSSCSSPGGGGGGKKDITVTTTSLPDGFKGSAYSQLLGATGGNSASYTWSVTVGTLPDGLTLSESGEISGTPTDKTDEPLKFTVKVVDGTNNPGTKELAITINAFQFLPDFLVNAQNNADYNQTVAVTGGTAPYSYTITAGALPGGLSMDIAGHITGTCAAVSGDTYDFTIEATDAVPNSAQKNYSITVISGAAVQIETAACDNGFVTGAYSFTLTASGGEGGSYTWSIPIGSLPAGLSLNASTGEISGTPTSSGTSNFTVRATDTADANNYHSKNLSITIFGKLAVSTTSCAGGTTGVAYSETLAATGGSGDFTWSLDSGSLPDGLSISAAGVITGTPTAEGSFSFTVKAEDTNNNANYATKALSISIGSKVNIGTDTLPGVGGNKSYNQTLSATGGSGGYTWTINAGSLPSGLTLTSTNGNISGYPVKPGTYNFTIKCADSTNPTDFDTQPLSIEVTNLEWTIMVYMDGDNNLETAAIWDFNELENVDLSGSGVNVLVLFDRIGGYDTSNGNWTGTRLYRVKDDFDINTINSELLLDMGEQDMSAPATLQNFIEYSEQNYPANHNVLVLWNHGAGVYPRNVANAPPSKGIIWDDTTGTDPWDCLTTDEVASALSAARGTTSTKLDIINMDACLMMMLEVAYEWRNEADYLAGSEEEVPGYGNDYTSLLLDLVDQPDMTPEELANIMVNDYNAFYAGGSGFNTTYSALHLSGSTFSDLITAFSSFAVALNATTDMANAYVAWGEATHFYDPSDMDLYTFAQFLSTESTDATVRSTASSLLTALDACIINHKETGKFVSDSPAFGLSILLPDHNFWGMYSGANQYVLLQLSNDTQWNEFVAKFAVYSETPPMGSHDTMSIKVAWNNSDCDVAVVEPDMGIYFTKVPGGNGTFSADQTAGGQETWTIKGSHMVGNYLPGILTWDYTGSVTITVTLNGNATVVTGNVVSGGNLYLLEQVWVRSQRSWKLVPYKIIERKP